MTSTDRLLALVVVGLVGVLLLGLAVVRAAPSTTGPDRSAAAAMVGLVNDVRAEHDLPALRATDDVSEVAERWSAAMAAADRMEHNPEHPEQICCWAKVTENVAFADPPRLWAPGNPVVRLTEELHEGLLGSPGHRANILDAEVDEVGIGVHVHTDGSVWITQNFRQRRD